MPERVDPETYTDVPERRPKQKPWTDPHTGRPVTLRTGNEDDPQLNLHAVADSIPRPGDAVVIDDVPRRS